MPLKGYGVLKGTAVDRRLGAGQSPHYQVRIVDDQTDYRIAVNVLSSLQPSTLEFLVVDDFRHPITAGLAELGRGFHALPAKPGGLALDFIRANLFDPRAIDGRFLLGGDGRGTFERNGESDSGKSRHRSPPR